MHFNFLKCTSATALSDSIQPPRAHLRLWMTLAWMTLAWMTLAWMTLAWMTLAWMTYSGR